MKKNYWYAIVPLFYIVLDQLSKYWCNHHIAYQERRVLIPHWLDLTLVYNKGVAFSLFSHQSHFIPVLIVLLALGICGYMLYHIFHSHFNSTQKLAAGLIIGGAIGNIIDRFAYGKVIDFILFYHGHFSWPVFNLADSFITIGAFLFIIEGWIMQRRAY